MQTEDDRQHDGDGTDGWAIGGPTTDSTGSPAGVDVVVGPESSIVAVDSLLDAVERSLARLDEGTYGRCDVCGSAIDDERLEREPTAEQCAACASAHTPGVTGPPF